jgi:hydroxymethylbilane synthase
MKVRIGTRASALALAQAESVAAPLRALGASAELIPVRTSGDRLAQASLAEIGGKGLFVREIEEALLRHVVDVAVHSLKDMPAALPPGLVLAAYPPREDPADVLVSRAGGDLATLPAGARVGTSSLRRRQLLAARRPDLRILPIRGNVDTRLRKLEEGQYDALVMAAAGLRRLGLAPVHAVTLPLDEFPPAVGQGILGLEARAEDAALLEMLARLDDPTARAEALAERAFLRRLGADCHTAVAAIARRDGSRLTLRGWIASPTDGRALSGYGAGSADEPETLGEGLADELLAQGAAALLQGSP